MPLSNDVLRGLRWGAILVAGLAIGVAGYRVVREPPAKPALEAPSLAPVLPAAEKNDSPPSAKTVDKPADKRSLLTSGSRPVPPPPARASKPVIANPRQRPVEGEPAGEPATKNDDESAVADEKPGPSAEPADEKDAGHGAAEKTDPAESSSPAALGENASKQEARGKRWIKTVGRWLGIGRKDPQPH